MNTALTFDTLAYVKHLKAADVPEKQAEAQAEALRAALDAALSDQSRDQIQHTAQAVDALDSSTGNAISHLETRTEKAIANLQSMTEKVIAEVRNDITQLRGELTLVKWMLGIVIAGVLSLVLKAFF